MKEITTTNSLHSTMVLLKLYILSFDLNNTSSFTFHYGLIKTSKMQSSICH